MNETTWSAETREVSSGSVEQYLLVSLDFATLELLRHNHPAWVLLRADLAPLVASFLHHTFIVPNVRIYAQEDLVEKLDDELFRLRGAYGEERFPRQGQDYLDDWARDDKAWLRKFYPAGNDEPHFDLTPATEKALTWLGSLLERSFVGTESRLVTVFELLRQIVEGRESDPAVRLAELRRRRADLDREIGRLEAGELDLLDDAAVKDRFQQMSALARGLLGDFREVEHNFRALDRRVRERIALWDGAKGTLLDQILGERDAIDQSDQGRSFRAFWEFLMSQTRQEEFSRMLSQVLTLAAVRDLNPDPRLRRIHYDWLGAGEHTQRTVSALSSQLRRFLDDKAWLENRRIMEILRNVESQALQLREAPPQGDFMTIDDIGISAEFPMERPLFSPPLKVKVSSALSEGTDDLDPEGLYSQVVVDKLELQRRLRGLLAERSPLSLGEVLTRHPLDQGLAELVAYLTIASEDPKALFDDQSSENVAWKDGAGVERRAQLPRVIFNR